MIDAVNSCTELEKKVFDPLKYIFLDNFTEQQIQITATKYYILELRSILLSNSRTIEQLQSLRDGLKIQYNFRRKTEQVTQQIKAQAIIAVLIYMLLLLVSYFNLSLNEFPRLLFCSALVFLAGIFVVFKIGGKIQWKI